VKTLSLLLLLVATVSDLCAQNPFRAGCELPFNKIATKGLDVDKSCGIGGGSNDAPKVAESNAKNNFCAAGPVTTITYNTFTRLEAKVTDDDRKQLKHSTDRKEVKNVITSLGEGSLVRFVGFLLDAHVSNKSKGELVNCTTGGEDTNDIHIELVKDANEDDACNSVTAEMSPHFRPEAWSDLPELKISRPVRLTGSLFFDGSHRPCHGNVRVSPNRISVWEIHPVYQFDVCKNKSLSSCKATDDSVWIPLDEWHGHRDKDTEDQ
jgi:hypothetical protein